MVTEDVMDVMEGVVALAAKRALAIRHLRRVPTPAVPTPAVPTPAVRRRGARWSTLWRELQERWCRAYAR